MKTLTLIIALVALAISLKPHLFGYGVVVCDGWRVVDKDGTMRIGAATYADGLAGVQWNDKDGKQRITATTDADGDASVVWFDKDEKQRINAATLADGTVVLPTKDTKD